MILSVAVVAKLNPFSKLTVAATFDLAKICTLVRVDSIAIITFFPPHPDLSVAAASEGAIVQTMIIQVLIAIITSLISFFAGLQICSLNPISTSSEKASARTTILVLSIAIVTSFCLAIRTNDTVAAKS